jgi:hypothetical protein
MECTCYIISAWLLLRQVGAARAPMKNKKESNKIEKTEDFPDEGYVANRYSFRMRRLWRSVMLIYSLFTRQTTAFDNILVHYDGFWHLILDVCGIVPCRKIC